MQKKDIACWKSVGYFWNQGNFSAIPDTVVICLHKKLNEIWNTKPNGTQKCLKKVIFFVWLPILMNYKIEFIFVVPLINHCLFHSNVQLFWLVNALLSIYFWKHRTKVCSVQLLYINVMMTVVMVVVVVLLLLCVQLTQQGRNCEY